MPATLRSKVVAEVLDSLLGRQDFAYTRDSAPAAGNMLLLVVADGASNQAVSFPGITTLATLWVKAQPATGTCTITLGPTASNQGKSVAAGGVIGGDALSLTASTALSVSYAPGDASTCLLLILWGGT